jgi:hypothetical protein
MQNEKHKIGWVQAGFVRKSVWKNACKNTELAQDRTEIMPPTRQPSPKRKNIYYERLRRLQKLRQDGVLTEEEYGAAKKKILEEA